MTDSELDPLHEGLGEVAESCLHDWVQTHTQQDQVLEGLFPSLHSIVRPEDELVKHSVGKLLLLVAVSKALEQKIWLFLS